MQVDRDEEERRAIGVQITQQPTVIDVAHDLLDRIEGDARFGGIMHGKDDAGEDLHDQHHREHRTEGVSIVQVARNRIGDERVVNEPGQRKTGVNPLLDARRWRVG